MNDNISFIWFRPYSEFEGRPDLDLEVRSEPGKYVPKSLSESERGEIIDLNSDRTWDSLSEMTHDLRVEIISWRLYCEN